ncbi:methyl-accepting chemotaxis protein [Chthonobacter albigriseus]|uniref:methyl-accepting chemotaxis protein n=1 Tax=Chthonobacter albigriseus TaxID=1683161 RepID=UPI0015EE75F7|nr:methyl-accepting chemotaxis protein [Chthonobacter albigriseus]
MGTMRIAFYSRLMSLTMAAVLVAAIAFGYGLIQKVRIGGPIYSDLIAGKDVIADVLPPPLYIIEAYLETSRAMLDPASVTERRARVEQLKADYDTRHAYWQDLPLTPELKAALLKAADAPAQRFFSLGADEFFPALAAGDKAAAEAAYGQMSAAYADHRAEIDRVVQLASGWYAATEAEAQGEIPWALSVIGALAVLVVTLVAAAGVLAERAVVRPIGLIAKAMRHLADGHADVTVPAVGRTTEMRELAGAMTVFADNARERAGLMQEVHAGRAAAEERKATLETLAMNFLSDADSMKTVLDREAHVVQGCAKAFRQTVETSESEAGQGLAAAVAAAENVRAVAEEAGRLSASTRQIAQQTDEARRLTEAAATRARGAEQEVQALTTVAEQIKSILESIGGIAAQTNLLSLNATIEASRAGEAGRGFAVVAAEVKALAGETAKATGEVDRLLQQINACTGAVVGSISRIVVDVDAVNALNGDVAAAIAEQERATAEIAQSAEQASISTDGARETNERLSAIVQEARNEVVRVGEASRSLFEVLGSFTEGTDRFLGTISQDMKERRKGIRHRVVDPADVIVGGRRTTTSLRDLSLTGAAVALVPGVVRGSAVTVVLGGQEIAADCVWIDDTGFGVKFRTALAEFPVELRKTG